MKHLTGKIFLGLLLMATLTARAQGPGKARKDSAKAELKSRAAMAHRPVRAHKDSASVEKKSSSGLTLAPITVGISSHFVNFAPERYYPGSYNKWQAGVAKLWVNIPLFNRLSIAPSFGFGKAQAPSGFYENSFGAKSSFWTADINARYLLTETKLQPYLTAGLGQNKFDGVESGTVNGGVGAYYWITSKLAINAEVSYVGATHWANYIHPSVGIAYKFKNGPKDSDKDGVPDEQDPCPKQAGTANGCPDADGDGVADKDDACPHAPGSAALQGCPDRDNDGVIDLKDNCPDQPGNAKNKGCPDKDDDGVVDSEDKCPNVAGLKELGGCPDTDKDGVADQEDGCPTVAGPVENKGCPTDRDKDGVADADDKCPDVAGTVANKGCPEIKVEEKKQVESKLSVSARLIQFETGSAIIKPVSYREIDAIVAIMNQYQAFRFGVEGHCDNVGNADTNFALSSKRADAVKAYIVGKGINTSRLDATGYGSDRPIAPNTTAAGRTANRRVEVHLLE